MQDNEKIIYTPRTGEEMKKAVYGHPPIYLYSELCDLFRGQIAAHMLAKIFRYSNKIIILVQDPLKMNSGHWISLSAYPKRKEIYFFSSYGGKPDEEKNRWISFSNLLRSGQLDNPLNDALKQMLLLGWDIHYSEFPFQVEGDNTATCGIWTAAFLNSDLNPEQFYAFTKQHHLTPIDYYKAYFVKE